MRRGVVLLPLAKLRAHERVCPQRLALVTRSIKDRGMIVNPVIVDKKTKVILDGHHRVAGLKKLGCRLTPAMEVDYYSGQVRVFPRRKNIKISKLMVISRVLTDKNFPQKTTRHLIRGRIRGVKIKLNRLK